MCVVEGPVAARDPSPDHGGDGVPPEPGPEVVQLRRTPRVGGVENLGEWRQLIAAGHQFDAARSEIVEGESDVEVHVGERLGEVSGLPFERVAVQQQHGHPGDLRIAKERQQEHGVGPVEVEVPIAEANVDLEGKSRIHRGEQPECQ